MEYQVSLGSWQARFPPLSFVPVAAVGGTEDLGRRMGIVNTVLAIGGLCGPPLGGLLVSTSLGYKAVGYFAGSMGLFYPWAGYSSFLRRHADPWRSALRFGSIFSGAEALGQILRCNL
jgi:predicted MFS family arabinose efflux permease